MNVKLNKNKSLILEANKFLRKEDPKIIPLLDSFQLEELVPEKNYFLSLTKSVIYQQLSGKAAKTILDRFIALYPNNIYPTPVEVIETEHDRLRSVGISNSKIKYIKNIAEAFINDTIDHKNIDRYSDEDIIKQLTCIKGIGPWTAQMFLMFTLVRSDIFPTGDLGIQKGFKIYFKLEELPSPETMVLRSEIWKPYRTIMAMYFWKIVDGPFEW